jgi:hypothetical protein
MWPLTRTEGVLAAFGSELPLVGDRQPLAPLGATALEHLLAILGRHTDQEAVRPFAPTIVGLKRTLTLRHYVSSGNY